MILLDTHIALWLIGKPEKLSKQATEAIQKYQKSGLSMSAVSLFEVAWLISRKRLAVVSTLEEFLEFLEGRFIIKPMNGRIAAVAAQLPSSLPSDPFDRIIAATAIVEGLPLVTADERIRQSGAVQTIW